MQLTPKIARAAAWAAATDAGNRSMQKAGRTVWDEDDYNASCGEFERLWPSEVCAPLQAMLPSAPMRNYGKKTRKKISGCTGP
jgi:hypothetical protein